MFSQFAFKLEDKFVDWVSEVEKNSQLIELVDALLHRQLRAWKAL
jgi:hypothetical protein